MNKEEYIFTVLSEECSEVAHAVSKTIRYGLNEHHPDRETTNEEELRVEICHFFAMVEMLTEEGILKEIPEEEKLAIVREKKHTVQRYMEVSRRIGTLIDLKE